MILSFGIIFLFGIIFAYIFDKLNLPRLLGMLILGIIIGPYSLNLIDKSILDISTTLRTIALTVILIRAGLTIDLEKIKENGRPAILLSFIPAVFEIVAYTILSRLIFRIDLLSSALMGTVMAAVSPAVVVPSMIKVIDSGYGNNKGIGQMILAGASLDDVFVLAIFSSLLEISVSGSFNIINIIEIPLAIIFAIILGYILGKFYSKYISKYIKNSSANLMLIFSISLIIVVLKDYIKNIIPFSEMLFVMSFSLFYKRNYENKLVNDLKDGFNRLWYGFEIILFVLIGASVDIRYTLDSGGLGLILIILTLFIRELGVYISLIKSKLNKKEKLFTLISYLPKATVQAAIGAVPLSMGINHGELILSMAVLGIIITAPLGAIGIDKTYKILLDR